MKPVYILGGAQSDFARNWTKEGKHFVAVMREMVADALETTQIEPREVQTAHVGNFAAAVQRIEPQQIGFAEAR